MGEKLNRLDRMQLYQLDRCVEMNRDAIERTTSWKEALEFVQRKLKEFGCTFPVTMGNIEGSCGTFGVRPNIPDSRLEPRQAKEAYAKVAALEVWVAALEAKLEEASQLGAMLAADAAALRGALVSVCQKTGIRPPPDCGLVVAANGRVQVSPATPPR